MIKLKKLNSIKQFANSILKIQLVVLFAIGMVFLYSCGRESSQVTGWSYNEPKNGGFEVAPYEEQETGPGLVLIQEIGRASCRERGEISVVGAA